MKKVLFILSLVWATSACQQQDVTPVTPQAPAANAANSSARLGVEIKEPTGPLIMVLNLSFGTVYYTKEGTSAPQQPSSDRGVIVLYSKFVNKQLPWQHSGKIVKRIEVYRRNVDNPNVYYYLTTFTGEYTGPQQQTVPPNKDLLNAGNSWYLKVAPGPYAFYYRYYDANNELMEQGQYANGSVPPAKTRYMGD
jgi:hypothetical protein